MNRPRTAVILGLIGLAFVVTNLVDGGLRPLVPTWRMLVLGGLPFAAAAGIVVIARRAGWKRLLFALVPLAVLILAAEIGLRIYFPRAGRDLRQILAPARIGRWAGGELFRPHHYTLFNLGPVSDAADGRRHNRLGFRDHREFVTDPGAIRIVFIGGSTTYTIGVDNNRKVFTARLEDRLNNYYGALPGDRRIEVVNAGLPQATSAENLIRLAFLVSEIEPDVVVIQHGINDGWPRAAGDISSDYGNYRKSWSPPPVLPPGRSIAASLAARLRFHSMAVAYAMYKVGLVPLLSVEHFVTHPGTAFDASKLETNGPDFFERNTRMMVALARQMEAEVVLATVAIDTARVGLQKRFVPEHNDVMKEIAADENTLLYDFATEMVTDADHMPDGRHVSQQGSELKAELWFRYLVETEMIPKLLSDG